MPYLYRVIIPYTEPTFILHRGIKRKMPYRAEYIVSEDSPEEAKINAIDQFQHEAKHAHVAWLRIPDYERIEVTLLPEKTIESDKNIYTGPDRRKKS